MNGFIEKDLIDESLFIDEKKVFVHDKKRNIFVMNDHGLAFYCWQKFFKKENSNKITVAHIDMHQDASFVSEEKIENGKTNYDDIRNNPDLGYIMNKYLSEANFIDTFSIRTDYNVKIILLVHENEKEGGFNKEKEKFEVETFSHKDENEFFNYLKKEKVDILDIDLDYFLDINEARNVFTPWSEERINNFFLNLFNAIKYPKIITVATSPRCMGEKNDTIPSKKAKSIYDFVETNLHQFYS